MRHMTVLLAMLIVVAAQAQTPAGFPADEKWVVKSNNARMETFMGKKAVRLRAGVVYRTDIKFLNGTIEYDYLTEGYRSFPGVIFRIQPGPLFNFEGIYFRPHKFGQWDALQYEPVFNGGTTWQLHLQYNFNIDFPTNRWIHVRIVVAGSRAEVYLDGKAEPVAVVDELQRDPVAGFVGFRVSTPQDIPVDVLTGNFANLTIKPSSERYSYVERRPPPPAKGFLTRWNISEVFGGPVAELPPRKVTEDWTWRTVTSDSTGIVNLSRYLGGVSRGENTVMAVIEIESDRDQVKKLDFSYSDVVGIYLNSQLLFTGNNAYNSKYERYLGSLNVEQDSLYLPLKKGRNTLVLVLQEVFGGWGFICRIKDLTGIRIR